MAPIYLTRIYRRIRTRSWRSVCGGAAGGHDRNDAPAVPASWAMRSDAVPGYTIDPATIDAPCRQRMAAFKRPRQVHVAASLPKTATGNAQRFLLREKLPDPTATTCGAAP